MEKIDIRQLSDRERALLRKQVIRRRKQGKGNKEVAEPLGLSIQTASRWWQWHLRDGNAMLAMPKRGRKHGKKRHLSAEQEKQIRVMIVDHYPDLKSAVHGNKGGVARSKETIRKKTILHLRHLQNSPRKAAKLFNHPKDCYAKAS